MAPTPPAPTSGPYPAYAGYHPNPAQPTGYAPAWQAPSSAPRTSLPVQQPRAPRGAGRGTFGVVVALTLLVLAGLLFADRLGRLAAPVGLTTIAAAVVFLGAAIAVAGIRGRSAGGLGALAIVLMLVAAPLAAADRYDWTSTSDGQVVFGDISSTPLTASDAEAGIELGAGNATIDLTSLPASTATVVVPIDVAAGDVTVVVPSGSTVSADLTMAAGDVRWFGDRMSIGFGDESPKSLEHSGTGDSTGPDLVLDISMGVGSLTVQEAGR